MQTHVYVSSIELGTTRINVFSIHSYIYQLCHGLHSVRIILRHYSDRPYESWVHWRHFVQLPVWCNSTLMIKSLLHWNYVAMLLWLVTSFRYVPMGSVNNSSNCGGIKYTYIHDHQECVQNGFNDRKTRICRSECTWILNAPGFPSGFYIILPVQISNVSNIPF